MPLSALVLLVVGLWNLSAPPLWWDEGWTLSLARNWVERGFYGHLLAGEPASRGLGHAFPVNAMVALSFRLLGIGIWQGRLVGVIFMVATLATMYHLARRLYDQPVALGTLFVLLFMSMHPQLHPVIMGRQVLAEFPMLFFLLTGYVSFLAALHTPRWFMPLTLVCWGIAIMTKAQPLPFWTASLVAPLLVTLSQRRWRVVGLLSIGLFGSFILSRVLLWLQQLLLRGHTLPQTPVHGLYEVVGFVLVPHNRIFALKTALTFGLPTLLGLCYVTGQYIKKRGNVTTRSNLEIVRLALFVLTGSWFAWYVLLSVGSPRYLFPPALTGSMFVATMLCDLTDDFSLSSTIKRSARIFRHSSRRSIGVLLAIIQAVWMLSIITLIAVTLSVTLMMLHQYYITYADTSALQVANFLNTQTTPDALIETYESELHFLLDRPYHYPPNQTHVELNRRSLLHQDVTVGYDPLKAKPDYLVVGRFAHDNHLYDPVLRTGVFRRLRSYGDYEIYARVR